MPFASATAALQRYVASEHESSWVTSTSKLYCALSHEIPVYGRAVFAQSAGGELDLSIEVKRKPHEAGLARLISAAPGWKHEARERDLGQVSYRTEATAFKLQHVLSQRVLLELEQGMFPTLSYMDWSDGRDEVQVALSAVNLRNALDEFLDCLAAVIPYNYEHVSQSAFNYSTGKMDVGDSEKRRLDELAVYLTADPSVKKVSISSYTDNRGYRKDNMEVSQRRAEIVRDYLVSKGVTADMFSIQAYGETKPRASNRTAKGRAMNRMVEVKLLK
jgi:outer membrane protein OmpA-like peptidoglycan-associated protein